MPIDHTGRPYSSHQSARTLDRPCKNIPRSPSLANISWCPHSGLARFPNLAVESSSPRRVTSTEPRTDDRQLSQCPPGHLIRFEIRLVLPMLIDNHSTPSSAFSMKLTDQKLHVVPIHLSPSDLKRFDLRRPTVKLRRRLPMLSLAWKLKALQPS